MRATLATVRWRVLAGAVAAGLASALSALVFLPACTCLTCDEDCTDCDPDTRYCLRVRDDHSRGGRHAYCVYLPESCGDTPSCACLLDSPPYAELEDLLRIAPESETCSGDATSGFEILGCTTAAVCPHGCKEKGDCPFYCCHLE